MKLLSRILRRSPTHVLVIDIGSFHVRAAHVVLAKGAHPQITNTVRIPIREENLVSDTQLFRAILRALDVALSEVRSHMSEAPDACAVFAAYPWTRSFLDHAQKQSDTPQVYTYKDIHAEALARADACAAQYATSEDRTLELIEFAVLEARLNGYVVPQLDDTKATRLDAAFYGSFMPADVAETLRHRIRNQVCCDDISLHSSVLADLSVVRDMELPQENAFFLDVRGGATTIALSYEGVLTSLETLPWGSADLLRAIARSTHMSLTEARSHLSLYQNGKLTTRASQVVEQVLKNEQRTWENQLLTCLKHISGGRTVPSQVIVAVDAEIESWVTEILETGELAQFIIGQKQEPDVYLVQKALTDAFVSYTPGATPDPFLAIDALFLRSTLANQKRHPAS